MSVATPAALLVGVALLGAGCGDDTMSKAEYERAFKAELEDFERGFKRNSARKGTRDELIESLEDTRRLHLRTIDALARLDPPDEVRGAHERFIRGARAYATGPARQAVEAWRRGDARGGSILSNKGQLPADVVLDTHGAAKEFRAKGYDLGEIGLLLP